MNAPLPPQCLQRSPAADLPEPPLASLASPASPAGSLHVWQSRYGTMVIEVRGDDILVNGSRVQRHVA